MRWTSCKITHVMAKADISHPMCKQCLKFLVEAGLAEEKNGLFQTTTKGLEFLRAYSDWEETMKK